MATRKNYTNSQYKEDFYKECSKEFFKQCENYLRENEIDDMSLLERAKNKCEDIGYFNILNQYNIVNEGFDEETIKEFLEDIGY